MYPAEPRREERSNKSVEMFGTELRQRVLAIKREVITEEIGMMTIGSEIDNILLR